jgi:hypothetical protein
MAHPQRPSRRRRTSCWARPSTTHTSASRGSPSGRSAGRSRANRRRPPTTTATASRPEHGSRRRSTSTAAWGSASSRTG